MRLEHLGELRLHADYRLVRRQEAVQICRAPAVRDLDPLLDGDRLREPFQLSQAQLGLVAEPSTERVRGQR
jgi:hypothetical protein